MTSKEAVATVLKKDEVVAINEDDTRVFTSFVQATDYVCCFSHLFLPSNQIGAILLSECIGIEF